MSDQVEANFDNLIDKVVVKFNFRKVKDDVTGIETRRKSVELELELLSVEGIIEEFQAGGKRLDLLVEAVREYQINRARELVSENESVTQDTFDQTMISWEAIANLPKSERRGGGIAKETWEDFAKDYLAVMPAATGKTTEQISNAAKILLNKLQAVKTNKPVLSFIKDQLAIYLNTSPSAETYSDCVQFLSEKVDTLLKASDTSLLVNLGA